MNTQPTGTTHRVNQKGLAKILGMSVSTLATMGLPCEKKGREYLYDVATCVKLMFQRERETVGSESEERTLLTRARRERQELLLAQERGDVILIAHARHVLAELGAHLKNELENLPHRLSGRLAGMSEPRQVAALLKAEVASVLSSFRKTRFSEPGATGKTLCIEPTRDR